MIIILRIYSSLLLILFVNVEVVENVADIFPALALIGGNKEKEEAAVEAAEEEANKTFNFN